MKNDWLKQIKLPAVADKKPKDNVEFKVTKVAESHSEYGKVTSIPINESTAEIESRLVTLDAGDKLTHHGNRLITPDESEKLEHHSDRLITPGEGEKLEHHSDRVITPGEGEKLEHHSGIIELPKQLNKLDFSTRVVTPVNGESSTYNIRIINTPDSEDQTAEIGVVDAPESQQLSYNYRQVQLIDSTTEPSYETRLVTPIEVDDPSYKSIVVGLPDNDPSV